CEPASSVRICEPASLVRKFADDAPLRIIPAMDAPLAATSRNAKMANTFIRNQRSRISSKGLSQSKKVCPFQGAFTMLQYMLPSIVTPLCVTWIVAVFEENGDGENGLFFVVSVITPALTLVSKGV